MTHTDTFERIKELQELYRLIGESTNSIEQDLQKGALMAMLLSEFPAIAKTLLDLQDMKEYAIFLFGAAKGKEDDIAHLKSMMKTCLDGWIDENKSLKAKL